MRQHLTKHTGRHCPSLSLIWMGLMCMLAFVMQKVYFLMMTWHEGTTVGDVLQVAWHGLRLDAAVTAYILILPLLVVTASVLLPRSGYVPKVLKVFTAVIALLTAVVIVADASLYPFWQFKLDSSVFLYTDKPKDAMASVSVWFILSRLLHIVVWTVILYKMISLPLRNISLARFRWPMVPVWIAGLAALFLAIRGGVGQGTNNVSVAYYSDNQYLNHAAVNPVFSLLYSMGKQEDFATKYQFFDEAERASIMKGIYDQKAQNDSALFRIREPQNVVLIVWEGCCESMAGCIGGPQEVTPCLNAIARESIVFSNCYANSFRTDRGLVCLMAGYPGLTDASLMKIPNKNEHLPALPRAMGNTAQPFKNIFWYGGDITFTNMGGYMRQAGFHRTVSDRDFTAAERTTDWGVPDEHLLNKVADDILTGTGRRFDAVMTLSSHEPWDVPTHRLKATIPNAFNYTDQCLGRFIQRLRQSPKWQHTLVIITADHGVMAHDSDTRYAHRVIHIPMLWTGGVIDHPMTVSRIMNQSDLAATLLGQLGISHDEFRFSRDVTSSGYTYPTATHTYNNGVTFIDKSGATTYDNDARRVIAGPDPQRERKAKATLQTVYKAVGDL